MTEKKTIYPAGQVTGQVAGQVSAEVGRLLNNIQGEEDASRTTGET